MTNQGPGEIQLAIQQLLYESRLLNQQAKKYPQLYEQGIYLPYWCCLMVGKRSGIRVVEVFYIEKQFVHGYTHLLIAWYPFHDFSQPPIRFWVYSGATLKKSIFQFTDQMPFRKSVFLFLPQIGLIRFGMITHYRLPHSTTYTPYEIQVVKDIGTFMLKSKPAPFSETDTKSSLTNTAVFHRKNPDCQPEILNAHTLQLLHQLQRYANDPLCTEEQKQALLRILSGIK